MTITIACPTCGSKLRGPDGSLGKRISCPKCRAQFVAEAPPQPGPAPAPRVEEMPRRDLDGIPPAPAGTSAPALPARAGQGPAPLPEPYVELTPLPEPVPALASATALAPCPFCAEYIQPTARKCRYCGEMLDEGGLPERARRERPRRRGPSARATANVNTQVVVNVGRSFPHILHLILTVCTGGLWLPIWILHYIFRSR